jgi:Ca-activated chloride channel family protein
VRTQKRALLTSRWFQRVLVAPLFRFKLLFLTAGQKTTGCAIARRWLKSCCAILIGGVSALGALACPQNAASQGSGPAVGVQSHFDRPMQTTANLVLVPVVVTDQKSHPVTNLQARDFSVFEDGQQQEIEYFETEDGPISVGLMLDVSRSMTSKFDMERAAVTEFFRNANSQDDYFAITFADRPRLVATSTRSIEEIQSGLAQQTPDGNTALFDAILEGRDQMRSAPQQRKALLVISDGGDNHSRHHLKQIKRLVQDSDVEVYAIYVSDHGPFKTLEGSHGKSWLTQITNATGGETITVDREEKIPEAAAAISREMRSRYVLGYRPAATRKFSRRKIGVQVTPRGINKSSLHAYYKTGYLPADPSTPAAKKN